MYIKKKKQHETKKHTYTLRINKANKPEAQQSIHCKKTQQKIKKKETKSKLKK